MLFKKCPLNPILKPNKAHNWENLCVLNPAVIYKKDEGLFYMLYRAAGDDDEHYIYIGLATSSDGVNFIRQGDKPIIAPDVNGADGGGTEDPRLIFMGGYYYLTYASRPFAPGQYWKKDKKTYGFQPPNGPSYLNYNNTLTHLAISQDLHTFKKLGRITSAKEDDRDVVIFPEKINEKYCRFSRPSYHKGVNYTPKNPSIWITYSTDLLEWDEPYELFYEGKEDWESLKVGISCPPLMTEKGWLVIYHGVDKKDGTYRVGAFLLDKDNPSKILHKTKKPFMEPEYPYETQGFYNGCVFPTALVEKDGILYMYYGAADHYIGLATCKKDDLLAYLEEDE